mgnify:FL=1
MEIRPNNEKDVFDENGVYQKKRDDKADFNMLGCIGSGLFGLLLIAYIILSVCMPSFKAPSGLNAWATFWPILLLADVPVSIVRAIKKGRFCEFSIWGVALFVYLFLGMYRFYWHPYWVILLSIPAYYFVFKPIDKLLIKIRRD